MGEPHDYADDGPWIDCWQCAGRGWAANCWEEFACMDPEEGCDDCIRDCDICKGRGGWWAPGFEPSEEPKEAQALPTPPTGKGET